VFQLRDNERIAYTAAGPSEGQVAKFVENNEVHAREVFG
jgi:hypothetical protein